MSTLDVLAELKESYLNNLPTQLDEMETLILQLEKKRGDYKENFESLYRKAHSLKGSAGTLGYQIVTSICHQLEDFLSSSLADEESVNQDKIDSVFSYLDLLREANSQLENKATDFIGILDKLESIKKKESDHELKGLFVGPASQVYSQMCLSLFEQLNIQCASIENGMTALQRLLHEHFDFLITSKENLELNGLAIIAALRLNHGKNQKIKTILITTDARTDAPESCRPDYIITKNKRFSDNLQNTMEKIKTDC